MQTITLYHGTTKRFSAFSKIGVTPRFRMGAGILGHYLTESESHVMSYARGQHGKIYTVEASFGSMKIVPSRPSGLSEIDGMQLDFAEADFAAYREKLVADGYDSVCFETQDGYCDYVFLYDDQLLVVDRVSSDKFQSNSQTALVW